MNNKHCDGFELLEKAIVLQAIKDYQWSQRNIHSHVTERRNMAEKFLIEVPVFLRSEYCKQLTDIPGEMLLKLLEKRLLHIKKGEWNEKI